MDEAEKAAAETMITELYDGYRFPMERVRRLSAPCVVQVCLDPSNMFNARNYGDIEPGTVVTFVHSAVPSSVDPSYTVHVKTPGMGPDRELTVFLCEIGFPDDEAFQEIVRVVSTYRTMKE